MTYRDRVAAVVLAIATGLCGCADPVSVKPLPVGTFRLTGCRFTVDGPFGAVPCHYALSGMGDSLRVTGGILWLTADTAWSALLSETERHADVWNEEQYILLSGHFHRVPADPDLYRLDILGQGGGANYLRMDGAHAILLSQWLFELVNPAPPN